MAVIKHEKLLPRATVEVKNGLGSRAYVWGSGKDGRCGNGKETNEKVPTQVVSKQTFKMIACGYHHSAGVSKDGAVLTWGRGIFG
jgi:alpha-tubulin suppressor-like RCC1 family protein